MDKHDYSNCKPYEFESEYDFNKRTALELIEDAEILYEQLVYTNQAAFYAIQEFKRCLVSHSIPTSDLNFDDEIINTIKKENEECKKAWKDNNEKDIRIHWPEHRRWAHLMACRRHDKLFEISSSLREAGKRLVKIAKPQEQSIEKMD